jgi:hypothetical protein
MWQSFTGHVKLVSHQRATRHRPVVCMSVMLSPLSRMRPTGFRVFRLADT